MFESTRRDLAFVPRWSIARVIHRQSVAEHSYYVACYGLAVARRIGWGGDVGALAEYLLRHDEDEVFTSDIPGPIKDALTFDEGKIGRMAEARFGRPAVPTAGMLAIRRVADLFDEAMYLAGEIAMGNRTVAPAFEVLGPRLRRALESLAGTCGVAEGVIDELWFELMERATDERTARKNIAGLDSEEYQPGK